MDMNIIVAATTIGLAVAAMYFARDEPVAEPEQPVSDFLTPELTNRGRDQGIDTVENILGSHGVYKKHAAIVDSMVLITMSKESQGQNLEAFIQADDERIIETGKLYVDRFARNPTLLTYFLVGVIETELDDIRTGSAVPLQDIHELRKTIDCFYYKNI
jgi:hypothetical protein